MPIAASAGPRAASGLIVPVPSFHVLAAPAANQVQTRGLGPRFHAVICIKGRRARLVRTHEQSK